MTDQQIKQIEELHKMGAGYKKIAQTLNISVDTVKSYYHRKRAYKPDMKRCPTCGTQLSQIPGHKPKKFCSDKCRNLWWNSHLDQVIRKANYDFICEFCGKWTGMENTSGFREHMQLFPR